jgi:hypothetical protein
MTATPDAERLAEVLVAQHHDLLRAVWRLEQAARLVPSVDETAWQGPARWQYDWVLAGLRRALGDAASELTLARDKTLMAVRTLAL